MKIAYVTSVYPSVSQRFIVREVAALRARGAEIGLFSVRQAHPAEVVGEEARRAFAETTSLIPMKFGELIGAMLWCATTRPLRLIGGLIDALRSGGVSFFERVRWIAYWVEACVFARHLVRGGFEHLHCHFGNAGSNVAMLAARMAGITFSVTCHGSELREIRRFRLADKVSRAAFTACISHFGRAQLMLACPPSLWEKLHIVRCGLAAHELGSPSKTGTGSKLPVAPGELGCLPMTGTGSKLPVAPGGLSARELDRPSTHTNSLTSRGFELLCVGRLSPEKGHLVLLEALELVRRMGAEFRLTLVGDGPQRAAIESDIQRRGLSEQVRLTGSLDPEQVDRQYETASAVVLASFSEGVPVVLMEAMGRGIPVVATQVGGVGELVENEVSGLLVPAGDANAMASAIHRLITQPAFALELGRRGIARVREEFDQERSADQLFELFDQVTRHCQVQPSTTDPSVCLSQAKTADS